MATLMVITSNRDNADHSSLTTFVPLVLIQEIATIMKVTEQGAGVHFLDHEDNSSSDGGNGLKGIGTLDEITQCRGFHFCLLYGASVVGSRR